MYDGHEDTPHDPEGPGNYAEYRFDFDLTDADNEDADNLPVHVSSHVHGVPPKMVVDALLATAKAVTMGHLTVFSNAPDGFPHQIKDAVNNMLASQYIKERLESPELRNLETVNTTVPNDASELFEDGSES